METKIFADELDEAAELIKNGSVVAVPTETVYGLAGNGLDEKAVRTIYELKGRPEIKPLSLMVSGPGEIERYCCDVPAGVKALAEKMWPGPLTIVLKAKDNVPELVRAGGKTLGLRCPDHKKTLKLLELSGVPFAAPSANLSGEESPKNVQKVMEYFDGRIPAVVDGGECAVGIESTILDMSSLPYKILREGAVTEEELGDAMAECMYIIGLTGGTGCGKTTALKSLEAEGALIIDCDEVYHRLLDTSEEMLEEIRDYFPEAFDEDGTLCRHELGYMVFSNAEALEALNSITHRHVINEVKRLLRDFAMNGGRLAALDAIELISSGLSKLCRFTVGVIAGDRLRTERIMKRDSIPAEYAMMRINAQRPMEYFEKNCDYIIYNDSTKEEFLKKFKELLEEAIKNG